MSTIYLCKQYTAQIYERFFCTRAEYLAIFLRNVSNMTNDNLRSLDF